MTSPVTQVLVSHPHAAAFANEVAAALSEASHLARYFTGVAATPGSPLHGVLRAAAGRRPEAANRLLRGLRRGELRALWLVECATRGWSRVVRRWPYDALFVGHDAAVAALSWPRGARAAYAYEDGALRTFRRARRAGMARIWDLPLPHWRTLERMWCEEAARWPAAGASPHVEPDWKKRRKDEELELADAVMVASRFTRESLEAIGCKKPISVVPYGFPTERFQQRTRRPDGPFTVIAVGSHDLRKGTPYLLEAWQRLGLEDARLRLVGRFRMRPEMLVPFGGRVEHVPHVPREALGPEYAAADLLVFPTLGDGFGMVIQEAMCCGVPVLTTRCGGGPECITADGREGWIVPERDVDAMVDRLRWAAEHRDALWEMGQAARRRAEQWTWAHARAEISRCVGAIVG